MESFSPSRMHFGYCLFWKNFRNLLTLSSKLRNALSHKQYPMCTMENCELNLATAIHGIFYVFSFVFYAVCTLYRKVSYVKFGIQWKRKQDGYDCFWISRRLAVTGINVWCLNALKTFQVTNSVTNMKLPGKRGESKKAPFRIILWNIYYIYGRE